MDYGVLVVDILRNGPRSFKFKPKLRIIQKEKKIQKAQNKNSNYILHVQQQY
jgi:hypothetical protein